MAIGAELGGRLGRQEERPVPQHREHSTVEHRRGVDVEARGDAHDVLGVDGGLRVRLETGVLEQRLRRRHARALIRR